MLGLAAAAGYKAVLDNAGELGDHVGGKAGDVYADIMGYNDNKDAGIKAKADYDAMVKQLGQKFADYTKHSNLGAGGSDIALQNDKRAMVLADELKSGSFKDLKFQKPE